MLGDVFHVLRGDLEIGRHQPESRHAVGEQWYGDRGDDDALLLPGDPESPNEDGIEDRQRGGAIEIRGRDSGAGKRGQRHGPGPAPVEREPGESQGNGNDRQCAHVRAFAIFDQHAQALRLQHPGVAAEARHEEKDGRHERSRHGAEPGAGARIRSHAQQQIDAGDAQRVEQRYVEVVSLDGPEAGELDDGGRAVAQGGRIDVVEARSGIPEGLPLGMRPVLGQEARVGDEGAFDGTPLILVPRLKVRADENRGIEKDQEKVEEDLTGKRARSLTGCPLGTGL